MIQVNKDKSFYIQNKLSQGKTSQVFLVTDKDGKQFAQKQFINPEKQRSLIQQEIHILKQLDHKHINKLEHCNQDNIYLEYLENGDLFSAIQAHKLSEQAAKFYLQQLVKALIYLHYEKNIAHRDIKLENIMLDSNNDLILCDFGYSKNYKYGEKFDEFLGTELYMSPQILQKKQNDPEKSDIFALGVVLFSMFMGYPPFLKHALQTDPYYRFFVQNRQEKYWAALQRRANFVIPQQFIDLVTQMLDQNEINRPSLQEIIKHPWLQE